LYFRQILIDPGQRVRPNLSTFRGQQFVQAGQPTLFWEAWPKQELSAFSTYAPPMIDAAFGWPFLWSKA